MRSRERVGLRTVVERRVQNQEVVLTSVTYDRDIVELNKRHQIERLHKPGKTPFPMHPDGAKIIYHFQADPIPWRREMKRHPALFQALHGKDQAAREKAAAQLAMMHPEWVVTAPRVRRVQ